MKYRVSPTIANQLFIFDFEGKEYNFEVSIIPFRNNTKVKIVNTELNIFVDWEEYINPDTQISANPMEQIPADPHMQIIQKIEELLRDKSAKDLIK